MKTVLGFLAFLLVGALGLRAEAPVQATLSCDRAEGTVGTRLGLSLVVKSARALGGVEVGLPEHPAFRVLQTFPEERQEAAGMLTLRRRWELACFDVGTHQLGPLEVRVRTGTGAWERVMTNPIEVEILSVLDEGDQDILPPKPPLELQGSPKRLLLLLLPLLGALLLAAGVWFWRRARLRGEKGQRVPFPWEQLAADLQALRRDRLLEKGQEEWFFVRMTQILRQYLARILSCPAEEWTTGEILGKLEQDAWEPELMSLWGQVLGEADLVKFARFSPGADASRLVWQHLDRIVLQARIRHERSLAPEEGQRDPSG